MTLHWWMHWFWVTLIILIAMISSSLSLPQSEELQHITSDTATIRHTERQGRAMYFPKTTTTTDKPFIINITDSVEEYQEVEKNTSHEETAISNVEEVSELDAPTTTLKSHELENKNTSIELMNSTTMNPLKILPKLNNTNNETIVHPSINWTPINNSIPQTTTEIIISKVSQEPKQNTSETNTTISKRRNSTPDFKDAASIEGLSESRIVTEKPLSLETSYLQTRSNTPSSNPNIESYRRVVDEGGMDTGAIAGISFAALVLAALAGSTAFVLYRRRYLNKPQTLNDKCSNPDSSGYLDDSTVRDNSEEMYSLDNDSFLNSLEAMTIQNYWTDTVKHTKL